MFKIRLCVFLFLGLASVCLGKTIDGYSAIDKYIWGMKFDKNEILSYKGESARSFKKKEAYTDESRTFVVITRELKNEAKNQTDIGVPSLNEHVTFPGAILLANSDLVDNNPTQLVLDMKPISYVINLPGLTNAVFTIKPTYGDYIAMRNQELKNWFENYPNDHKIEADFQSEYSLVYSKDQLRVKFGLNVKGSDIESDIDFDAVSKQKKLVLVHKFKQIFYTVSVEPTQRPSDLFTPDVTLMDLIRSTNDTRPPVIVDSVAYGRVIYVKIETTSTDASAKATLQYKLNKLDNEIHSETDYSKKLENFSLQVYVLGGSNNHIELIKARNIKDVLNVILKYSQFDRDNLGSPISYSTQFLKDHSRALVQSSTSYIDVTRTEHHHGLIRFEHWGWYLAQFELEWDEISFGKDDTKNVIHKRWEYSGITVPRGYTVEIELPGNSENITVVAWDDTALVGLGWVKVIERQNIPLVKMRTFTLGGTTGSPTKTIDPPID